MKGKVIRLLQSALVLLSVLAVIGAGCSKKNAPPAQGGAETNEAGTEGTQTKPKVPTIDNNVILSIVEKKHTNGDFKAFVNAQYPDMAEPDSGGFTTRILSRIFDSFVENKIISYAVEKEPIPVKEGESSEYLGKLKVDQDENLNSSAASQTLKVHKFLFYKIYDKIEVTAKEIRDYYNRNLEEFRKKPEVHLYQILLKDRETAISVRGQLKANPARFEEIAREKSIAQEAVNGGRMGYFEKGTLPKDMEDVVFSLRTNSISPVVESTYGFHIFKVTEKKKGRLLYLQRVEGEIKQKLLSQKMRKAYQDFYTQLKTDLNISINYDKLYFEYQSTLLGEKGDENKKTINTTDIGGPDTYDPGQ